VIYALERKEEKKTCAYISVAFDCKALNEEQKECLRKKKEVVFVV